MTTAPSNHVTDRRTFLRHTMSLSLVTPVIFFSSGEATPTHATPIEHLEDGMSTDTWFRISLAQWSLHRMLRADELDPMDFPSFTRKQFGINAVEYVNSFYKDRAKDPAFPAELRSRAEDAGVESLLIMIDGEGALGAPDPAERELAIDNHRRWLEIAKALGCHSIRVNAISAGTPDEQLALCAKGMSSLLVHADALNMNVLIENHGGNSSNGAWLSNLMQTVDNPRFGTLPDFGNFMLDYDTKEQYDRYLGMTELMPYAKAVSAKSHAFDEHGTETGTSYERTLGIVKNAGYRGWIGIEYEGDVHDETRGIEFTRDLLLRHGGSC
jgi:L-ribulose-5-phosphate 3-epimerase